MNYGFIIDNRRCIGCHACTVACKAEHETPIGVNRTWVKYVEKGVYPYTRRVFSVLRCNHCADAPCVNICPVRSLFKRPDGIVDFDRQRCIACKACMQACPYDALHIDPNLKVSTKCNYCAHRIDLGLEPACVNVCPVHAIVSGDLDDSTSTISRTLGRQAVSVRKPEKNTRPKLFYINADQASIRPEIAPPNHFYTQAEQAGGVGHFAKAQGNIHSKVSAGGHTTGSTHTPLKVMPHTASSVSQTRAHEAPSVDPARRTLDAPQKGILWDWEVTGYLWTKSIAAGVVFLPLLLNLLGLFPLSSRLELGMGLISLLFLGLTGLLLVKDLDQPKRFLYVLLRPQWKSWLVRGAYIISAYGGLATLWLLMVYTGQGDAPVIKGLLVVLGLLAAVYTAFLFAQAKGRDLWQSPLMPVNMVLNSAMTGSAVMLLLGLLADQGVLTPALYALMAAIVLHLLVLLVEFNLPHVTKDTEAALHMIKAGPLRLPFLSSVLLGNVAPLALLWYSTNGLLMVPACILVLLFALVNEHVWVRAPQLVPLS